jgi:hypothetical protein
MPGFGLGNRIVQSGFDKMAVRLLENQTGSQAMNQNLTIQLLGRILLF